MTISPPAKVDRIPTCPASILASGVDTLVLAIDVTWKDESFFEYLQGMKALAQQGEADIAVTIGDRESQVFLLLAIKPFGSKGYEWVLQGSDYTLTIGNWLKPKSRPSIMAQIHSEALWSLGPDAALNFLLTLLSLSGAKMQSVKPSRVDLCVDYLLPEKLWSMNLVKYKVTRAAYCAPHVHHDVLTGISIGKGKVAARLYDKPLEIKQKSKKFWMYEVWGIKSVPEGYRIIRVESQFRREAIKELGIDLVSDLFGHLDNLWAYFSQEWLKFQNNPGKHHLARKTLPFWVTIRNGFFGVQDAQPLIRCQSLQAKKKQLAAQAYGLLNSFLAVEREEKGAGLDHEITMEGALGSLGNYFEQDGKNEFELNIDILTKWAKHYKAKIKMREVHKLRSTLGFPSNLAII